MVAASAIRHASTLRILLAHPHAWSPRVYRQERVPSLKTLRVLNIGLPPGRHRSARQPDERADPVRRVEPDMDPGLVGFSMASREVEGPARFLQRGPPHRGSVESSPCTRRQDQRASRGNPLASFHDQVEAEPSPRSFGFLFTLVFALIGRHAMVTRRPGATVGDRSCRGPRTDCARSSSGADSAESAVAAARAGDASRCEPVGHGRAVLSGRDPFGLVRQAMRKGLTPRLIKDPKASTYWIDRAGQPASRMDQQF